MKLIETYKKYKMIDTDFNSFIENLLDSKLEDYSELVANKLTQYKDIFENLKVESDAIEVDEDKVNDLRDLKYLIVDSFFLIIDLENFYKYKEFERFKMRAVNHINKRRRASFAQYFAK